MSGFADGAYNIWWMSDVVIHHFCLGDMVELMMVLKVVFKFVLWSHMEMQSS